MKTKDAANLGLYGLKLIAFSIILIFPIVGVVLGIVMYLVAFIFEDKSK